MQRLLARLAAHAERQPHAVALMDGATSLDYQSLWQQITDMVPRLQQWSTPEGAPLALAMDNQWQWVVVDLAAALAGIPMVPLPPFFTDAQCQHVLADSGCVGVVYHADDQILCRKLEPLSRPVVLPSGCIKITYTSGTTGQPKGVCLSGAQLDATVAALAERIHELSPTSHLCTMPLAVLLEDLAGIYLPLWLGKRIELCPLSELGLGNLQRPDPQQFLQRLAASQADSLILLPATLGWLVAGVSAGVLSASRWQLLAVGGGKCSLQILQQAKALGLPVYEGYGLSEVGSVVALNAPSAHKAGSVGKPLDHIEVRLAADGEVLLRGNAMLGYLGQTEPACEWLATGDLGEWDEEGFLHISGRKKSTIVTAFGRNVSPEWIEAELLALPGVLQAFVYGDEEQGVRALLFAPSLQASGQADTLLLTANARLPAYARLGSWQFIDSPFSAATGELTANGRLRREQIRLRRIEQEVMQ